MEQLNTIISKLNIEEENCCSAVADQSWKTLLKEGSHVFWFGMPDLSVLNETVEMIGEKGRLFICPGGEEVFELDGAVMVPYQNEKFLFPDQSVDCIISFCIYPSVNRFSIWDEFSRIMKNDGRFWARDFYSTHLVPDRFKKSSDADVRCWSQAIRKDLYRAVLQKAGFLDVEIYEKSSPYSRGEIEVVDFLTEGCKKSGSNNCHCS